MSDPTLPPALAQLADLAGIQTSYTGVDGQVHAADEDVVRAVLGALGTPADDPSDVAEALAGRRQRLAHQLLEPVIVHRLTPAETSEVSLPHSVHPGSLWVSLTLEDGRQQRARFLSLVARPGVGSEVGGHRVDRYLVGFDRMFGGSLPAGYHQIELDGPSIHAEALLIAAPRCPLPGRGWSAFLPLHALRTNDDWGLGSYRDLGRLGAWVRSLGAAMVGTLPLTPLLDQGLDPSPYLPATRMGLGEHYIDPLSLPELAIAPDAAELLSSPVFVAELNIAHRAPLADYEAVVRLKRQVLGPMAQALFEQPSPRRQALEAFAEERPELADFARFRSAGESTGRRWADWPGVEPGRVPDDLVDERAFRYHLYCQWVADQQVEEAGPLYVDVPVGVHPEGFDPFWQPEAFATGAAGGAPPDGFFGGGQNWSFPPLHPEGIRDQRYRYVIGYLRRALSHAACLRIDHVMGLHRLYWVPRGFDARHGAYVRYRPDELHAIVALEATRAGATIVGEDLGTVPAEVRRDMDHDRMLRSWVLQFETTPDVPLPPVPTQVLASWGTHDLPRFAAYFDGRDIDAQEAEGVIDTASAADARRERQVWRDTLLTDTLLTDTLLTDAQLADAPARPAMADVDRARRRSFEHLAASPARLLLVDLEELWGEVQPQNRPGTGADGLNWRRRATLTLEDMADTPAVVDQLADLDRLRRTPTPDTTLRQFR